MANLLFHLDFDEGFNARTAMGDPQPANDGVAQLVPGMQGRAARFVSGSALRYWASGNLNKDRGAMALWIQAPVDEAGNDGEWRVLFAEEGPNEPASNAMSLRLEGGRGLRWDIRVAGDETALFFPQVRRWLAGQWHHVIVNWDAGRGYWGWMDGRPSSVGPSKELRHGYLPVQWTPRAYSAFFIGGDPRAGDCSWGAAVDEVRIFDGPLTDVEAVREFERLGRFGVVAWTIDPFLWVGVESICRLAFENQSDTEADLRPRFAIADQSGALVQAGDLESVQLAAGQRVSLHARVILPKAGRYWLAIDPGKGLAFQEQGAVLYGVPPREAAKASKEEWVLVGAVDVASDVARAESASTKVVDSPAGRYREAGPRRHDRFAVPIPIREAGRAHLAAIRYPDDKPRSMEAALQHLTGVAGEHPYQGRTGVFTGEEYALSGEMLEMKVLFWPETPRQALIFMTEDDGRPAAAKDVRVYQLQGRLRPLPVNEFRGSVAARTMGAYFEDPVLPRNFGAGAAMPAFEQTVTRFLDYLEWMGHNLVYYPVVWYRGPLWLSEAEPQSASLGPRPHPEGFPAYLMKRLHARGMKFIGGIHLHELPSLRLHAITDMKRVQAGEETVINVRADDTLSLGGSHAAPSDFNPLDPRVQSGIKAVIGEFLDRYGDEPALSGIALMAAIHKMFQFGSIEVGYNDCNLAAFQRETGLRIAVDGKDPQRFSKSYAWLMANAREEWIDWRRRKIHDFYRELAAMITAKRTDLKLYVNLLFHCRVQDQVGDYLNRPGRLEQMQREYGVDISLFDNDPNIAFLETFGPADYRHSLAKKGPVPRIRDTRTFNFAPPLSGRLRWARGSGANLHDRYWESPIGRTAPLPLAGIGGSKDAREMTWRVSTLNPNTFHCLETYVSALENIDAQAIAKGGFVSGFSGIEPYVGRFAQAFRALPAVKFDDVEGLADPVRVRQKVVDGRNLFYVLNRLPFPASARLDFSSPGALENLVTGEKVDQQGGLQVALSPYELASFADEAGRVRVTGGEGRLDHKVVEDFQRRLAEASARVRRRADGGRGDPAEDAYLALAEECLAQRQYARLHFLLQESWNRADDEPQ